MRLLIANANTTGYRGEGVVFSEVVRSTGSGASLSMATARAHVTNMGQGALAQTGGAFDLAIEGEGFFMVQTPDGPRLTRAGHFGPNEAGDLVTAEGHPVLDAGGAPLIVPVGLGPVGIAPDGTVQGGSQTGYAIALGMDLVPDEMVEAVGAKYVAELAAADNHLTTGFLGTRLREQLGVLGHDVTQLVRRAPGPGEVRWDPYGTPLGHEVVDNHDVVVNLAGSPTAGNPHSKKWAENLMNSRVTTTRVLAEAIAASAEEASRRIRDEGGALDALRATLRALEAAAAHDDRFAPLVDRAHAVSADAEELGRDAAALGESVDLDPASRAAAEKRLTLIRDLERKYGDSVEAAPPGFAALAGTAGAPIAAFEDAARGFAGVQWHPESGDDHGLFAGLVGAAARATAPR